MNRGQTFTLEAVIASLVLLSSMVLMFQIVTVTPLSASTSSQFVENEMESSAESVLTIADDRGALKDAVLFWNPSSARYWGEGEDFVAYNNETGDDPLPTLSSGDRLEFGRLLQERFDSNSIAYNVMLYYQTPTGVEVRRPYITNGVPSDNAVSASRYVVLMDDDELLANDGSPSGIEVRGSSIYMNDIDAGNLFNVVRIEVVVWRN